MHRTFDGDDRKCLKLDAEMAKERGISRLHRFAGKRDLHTACLQKRARPELHPRALPHWPRADDIAIAKREDATAASERRIPLERPPADAKRYLRPHTGGSG